MIERLNISGLSRLLEVNSNLLNEEKSKQNPSVHLLKVLENNKDAVIAEIEKRKQGAMVYSVEDIFRIAGQYDAFVIFSFYPTSEAYHKYGAEVYGHIKYLKNERDQLEELVLKNVDIRTDGLVKLDGSLENRDLNQEMLSNGFNASDVYNIQIMAHAPLDKQYNKDGIKEIPNTIEVPFQSEGFDIEAMELHLIESNLQSGHNVLEHDMLKYSAITYVLLPDALTETHNKYLYGEDEETLTEQAYFAILSIKHRRKLLNDIERKDFYASINERTKTRFEIIKRELGISSKDIDSFAAANPEAFFRLKQVAVTFQTETLSNQYGMFPIFWDFKRFIHIYLRHYKEFYIEKSTARGTHFQYNYKDIRRLACLVTESLQKEIDETLSTGKPYAKYGDKGYYFNGNYYNLRIDPDGKLMQFHPLSNKSQSS